MSSSLSKMRSIAISYGTVVHPTPTAFFDPAHVLGTGILNYLWNNWGKDDGGLREGEVDLYNVNIPLVEGLLSEEGLKVCWTTMWRNSYKRLFKAVPAEKARSDSGSTSVAGPDALDSTPSNARALKGADSDESGLVFKWAPTMDGLITPVHSSLPVGSDGWAISNGWASVTPLRAAFAEPLLGVDQEGEARIWKMKL